MNITLIGMPGSGKSTIGRRLARITGLSFVDVDDVIRQETGLTLKQIIDRDGDDGFRAIESRINAGLRLENAVIAPGGSVVYGEEAMAHLRAIGTVVYLRVSESELLCRLGDLHERGVSIREGQTFHDLYAERCPLYERYAHFIVDTEAYGIRRTAELIAQKTGAPLKGG